MRRRLRAALFAATLAGGASAAAADASCPAEAQGFRRLKGTDAEIAYRWEPSELKIGQFFAVEVVACRAPGSEPVTQVALDATMPAHGHGMNYRPKPERTPTGNHRFTGLMLHMPGTWRITFDLLHGSQRTRLAEEVDLK